MILETLKLRGIGPFKQDVALDFIGIPDGSIVALVGDNGQGKTTLLECLAPAPLYREFPSYRDPKGGKGEPLASHVRPHVRDGLLEVTYRVDGRPVVVRVEVDGKRNKTEAYVTVDGQTRGPLLKEVDQVLATLFPSRALLLAGPFACQGGFDGFFRLGPSDRKDLFAELLGLGHIQELAEAAGLREKDALAALGRVREQLQACAPAVARLAEIRTALAAIESQVAAAQADHAAAVAARDEAAAAHAAARDALTACRSEAERTETERARLTAGARADEAALVTLRSRLTALDTLLADAPRIREAVERLAALDAALEEARGVERTTAARLPELEGAVATASAERDQLLAEWRRVDGEQQKVIAAAGRIAELAVLEAERADEVVQLQVTTDDVAAYDARMGGLEEAADTEAQAIARRKVLETRRDLLKPRRGLLDQIPGVDACATCPLTADARKASEDLGAVEGELAELPAIDGTPAADTLRGCRTARKSADEARARHQTNVTRLDTAIAARAADRETAARADAVAAELAGIVAQGSTAKAALTAATEARDACRTEVGQAQAVTFALETDRAAVAADAARLPEVAAAEGQRTELATQQRQIEDRLAGTRDALAALPAHDIASAEAYVRTLATREVEAGTAVDTQTAAVASAERERARLEGERDALGDPEATRERCAADEAALVVEAADWAVLARALGKNGVQSLLLDAAGPGISAVANDLLATCYTPRFQISLSTTVPTADGKGVREIFECRVIDAEAGRDGTRGSGGETAMIDAALRLAIVIENTRRSGCECRTLFLDEATAALSPENASRYVAMLRRAMQVGGFTHVFVVSHQQDLWEQADFRIIVEDGTARLRQVGVPIDAAAA